MAELTIPNNQIRTPGAYTSKIVTSFVGASSGPVTVATTPLLLRVGHYYKVTIMAQASIADASAGSGFIVTLKTASVNYTVVASWENVFDGIANGTVKNGTYSIGGAGASEPVRWFQQHIVSCPSTAGAVIAQAQSLASVPKFSVFALVVADINV